MRFLKLFGHLFFIVFLTILTQVGGIIWMLSILLSKKFKKQKRIVFPLLYLLFNLIIIPPIAKVFGREPLPVINQIIKPRNIIYPILFRNYVTSEFKSPLIESSIDLAHLGIQVTYLDANFPFWDGFPLLPHLSHNDGKKIDISFMYIDIYGNPTTKKPSVSGYGAYVNKNNPTATTCLKQGYWQYDFPKYLTFGTLNNLTLDKENTKTLIQGLLYKTNAEKLFIEPYLKTELELSDYSKIRFHGCKAVRHDDHIHLQVK